MNKDVRKKVLLFSIINLIMGLVMIALTFYVFHFVTDRGLTFVYHKEVQKPFVALLTGMFSVLCLFASATAFIFAKIFFKKES